MEIERQPMWRERERHLGTISRRWPTPTPGDNNKRTYFDYDVTLELYNIDRAAILG